MTLSDVWYLALGWQLSCGCRLVLDFITNEFDRRKRRRATVAARAADTADL